MVFLLQAFTFFFACASMVYSLVAISRMTLHTSHAIRLAFVALSSASFWEALAIFHGKTPDYTEALLFCGVGMLTVFGRREHFKCPYAPENPKREGGAK